MIEGLNDHTLLSLLNFITIKYSDRVILQHGQNHVTNTFLGAKSTLVANILQKHVDKPEEVIPLIVDRSVFAAIGIFGILKTGSAFLLIEPNDPEERIDFILQETKSKVIITQGCYLNKFTNFFGAVITIDKDINEYSRSTENNLESKIRPENIACVVYTSGTTGKPKGISISHRSIVNRLMWMWVKYPFEDYDVVIQKTSVNFVDFIWELLGPILYGIKVFIYSDIISEYMKLSYTIKNHYITNLVIVPSVLEQFVHNDHMDFLNNLKRLHISGEKISTRTLSKIKSYNKNLKILNLYGSSEVTADATCYEIKSPVIQTYLIGKAISNSQIFILDKNLNKTLPGKVGNIYISGLCLARGYINNPELTAEKFIANPFFQKDQSKFFLRMYNTGDEGVLHPDGDIEFLGRSDSQVKIRGQRIELQEIERVIETHPIVKQSAVVLREKNNNQYLVAYYTKNVNFISDDNIEYINSWKYLYQYEYSLLDINYRHYDMSLWRSSYSGQAIPREEMIEWVESTVSRISNLKPHIILEIGCGSGLILTRLIEQCNHYYATDFSEKSVEYIKELAKSMKKDNSIEVFLCSADNIPFCKFKSQFDTVVINSVTQYFPNLEYLHNLINCLINNIDSSGKIFIGDIRDYRLLESFHYSLIKYKNLKPDKSKIEYFSNREKELLISPEYFYSLRQVEGVSHIEIMPKMGIYCNEMNNYRYDVIIYIQKSKDKLYGELIDVDKNLFKETMDFEQYFLSMKGNENIYITYPNKRICKNFTDCSALLGKLCNIEYNNSKILSINEIENLVTKEGYRCKFFLDWSNPLNLQIALYDQKIHVKYFNIYYLEKNPFFALSNDPVANIKLLDSSFATTLKKFLRTKLTDAMIPLYYVPIKTIPITKNGKIDKKALIDPVVNDTVSYVPPRNQIEGQICKICATILGLSDDFVGIKDNFFKLGGNSILAIKFVNNLNKKFNVNISISTILEYNTLDIIARFIDGQLHPESENFEEGTL